ncbi:MAG: nucleotidyltransferase domain-containing protein [Christensenellales bacterium]
MIDVEAWISQYAKKLEAAFPNRICFIGLQGSYSRGDATMDSDIDVVAIFNTLDIADIAAYGAVLDTLPYRELVCGFISGKAELSSWETSELFQFYYDTTPIKGDLDELLDLIDIDAVKRAALIGACGIYHACVHNMLHNKDTEMLRGLYKAAAFVVQAKHFCRTGRYLKSRTALVDEVELDDERVLRVESALKCGGGVDFDMMSEHLFRWSQGVILHR